MAKDASKAIEYRGARLCVELPGGDYRYATQEEADRAVEVHTRYNAIQRQMQELDLELAEMHKKYKTSKVFYDTAGFPYDVRHFIEADKTDLI